MLKSFFMCLFVGIGISLLTSCTPEENESFIEKENSVYQAGKQKMREGNFEGALDDFLDVIDTLPYSPESHLEAGLIYLRHEDQPLPAIYHFKRNLQQNPDGRESHLVEDLILSAEKQFIASLAGNPFRNDVKRLELAEKVVELKEKIEALGKENVELKQENEQLRQRLSGTENVVWNMLKTSESDVSESEPSDNGVVSQPVTIDPQVRANAESLVSNAESSNARPATYKVQAGDSLYGISKRFYGDSEHIQSIFQANRSILRSVDDLRPGQVLNLP